MQFGVFDHLDHSGAPLGEHDENRLRLIETYDRLGIHRYHLAEHHATPLGLAPSPSVFLAAVAQRTRRLRFGPLVYTLSLHHPLRVVEEVCMLDQMSGGRFELGVGRGISPHELAYYGVDPAKAQGMYVEALQIILQGLCAKTLTFSGEHYAFRDVPIEMHPVQRPHPPLWYGLARPDGLPGGRQQGQRRQQRRAPAGCARSPTAIAATGRRRATSQQTLPLMGMARAVVVAETSRGLAIARRAHRR
jgi:alkanesulfonate monooxygenase SsuD/methylene tetrahydromethanopterin reductase-like flavin-dependent oxidoreductase (luciferase family)